jgi:O-phospho-L-seryl-tRNASec:L-selenocysteinyl-tRNA synthase
VVSCLEHKTIAGHEFKSFGAHHDEFPVAYVTFACALGMQRGEVDLLVTKLSKTIHEWRAKQNKAAAVAGAAPSAPQAPTHGNGE